MYWDSYDKWYDGEILEYDEKKNKYKVQYDDGDLMWESYDDGFKIIKMGSKKKEDKENKEKDAGSNRKEPKKDDTAREQKTVASPQKVRFSCYCRPY